MIAGTPISGTTGNAAPVSQAPLCWICSLPWGRRNERDQNAAVPHRCRRPAAGGDQGRLAARSSVPRCVSLDIMWPISIITHLQAGLPELHARAHPPRS